MVGSRDGIGRYVRCGKNGPSLGLERNDRFFPPFGRLKDVEDSGDVTQSAFQGLLRRFLRPLLSVCPDEEEDIDEFLDSPVLSLPLAEPFQQGVQGAAPCLSPFRKGASVPEGSGAFPEKLELVVRIEDPVIVSERSSVNGDPLLSAVDRHSRHEGFAVLQLQTPLHRRHIAAYRRFASRKVVLLHQPAVYPFCRMALVPRVFKVLFQPLVDDLVMGGPSTGKGCVFLGEYLSIPPEGLFHGVFRMPGFPGYFAHVLAVRSLRGLYVFVLIHPEDTFPPASSSWCSFTTAKPRLGGQFSAVVRSKKSGQVKSVKITAVSISLAIHKRMIMTCHNRRETVKVKVSIGQPLCTR